MTNRKLKEQLMIFPAAAAPENPENTPIPEEMTRVSFRELVPEIRDTGYLTHAIFAYPAKFIPQVVRYAIDTFTQTGDWIVDPFAGSGTVGVEAYLCKRNAVLLDLNPLLNHLMPMKVYREKEALREERLCQKLDDMEQSTKCYLPAWSNVDYWYPEAMLEVLSRYWGFIKTASDCIYARIIESGLLKASKHFSYAEHRTPKLARSKSKLKSIEALLQEDWKAQLRTMVGSHALKTLRCLNEFMTITRQHDSHSHVAFHGGVDSSYHQIQRECDALITSPPYLQAQEYIRSTKMELFWLGYCEEKIRELSRLEIPYRKADRVMDTPTLEKIRTALTRPDLRQRLDSYFCHTLNALENAMNCLKPGAPACIFVGNPKIDGITVEIWRIAMEYFCERGWTFEHVYEDRIQTRKLFGARKNKNPDGMKSEYLLVLRK